MTIDDEADSDESEIADYDETFKATDVALDDTEAAQMPEPRDQRLHIKRILAFGLLPGAALILTAGAGFLKWQSDSTRDAGPEQAEAVQAATESTIALLSYRPDTADKELNAARDRLTGVFRGEYTKLINDVVIPGAKKAQISAIASVPAAAPMSVSQNRAVVLLFVDQSVVAGTDPPTSTASTVRVTLEKDRDRWLISNFDPV